MDEVARVLAGSLSYDALDAEAQAVVRAAWDERIADRIERLDYAHELEQAGVARVEADADGNVVLRGGDGSG